MDWCNYWHGRLDNTGWHNENERFFHIARQDKGLRRLSRFNLFFQINLSNSQLLMESEKYFPYPVFL